MSAKRNKTTPDEKSAICVFSGRDSKEKNYELGRLLAFILYKAAKNPDSLFAALLREYFFIFTEGTFNRMFVDRDPPSKKDGRFWVFWSEYCSNDTFDTSILQRFFQKNCIRFPGYREGGIVLFANMVATQRCSIVWPFLDPHEAHCTRPENLALLRLCDVWKAKWLPNFKSVLEWIIYESEADRKRSNRIKIKPGPKLGITLPGDKKTKTYDIKGEQCYLKQGRENFDYRSFRIETFEEKTSSNGKYVRDKIKDMNETAEKTLEESKRKFPLSSASPKKNLAFIAHDTMKPRMVEFVVEYKKEIDGYVNGGKIYTTQATGKEIERNILDTTFTDKIVPCLGGPLGGDIEIATLILLTLCDTVIFFIDPLNPHPHVDDIRVVLMAGMTNPDVRVLTNETASRAWAEALRERFR